MGLNQDLDNIKAIEDKLTANKVAKFAYTDHAYNNPLTEADGVTYYNVDNEQNIPVADPSVMNVNETVLTKGWRSQASSVTRMLMNHFLGRVSYNLNKLNDNMSALLTTLRTNLSNVVNTGDSANASSGGTTKFTTGGAYNLLSSIAPYFSTSATYAVGALLTYQNRLYECTTAHSAGVWNANHFTARSVQYVINNYILPSLAPDFSVSTAYVVGDLVIYQNKLYRCTVAHRGAWSTSDFTLVTVGDEVALKADKASLALPTDAVLHYSFDEVSDYPDGTAVYKHIKDFTSTSDWTINPNRTVLSLDNNGLKAQSTSSDGYVQLWGAQTDISNISNKIVKIKWHSNANCTLYLQDLVSPYGRHNISQKSLGNNVYEAIGYTESFSTQQSLFFLFYSVSADNYVVIDEIYIGNGSYSTPIIDNANGQNNALNSGGIATNGVSGKGVYFPSADQGATIRITNLPAPTSNDDFTISFWLNISTSYVADGGSITKPIVEIGSTLGTYGFVRQYNNILIYCRDSENVNFFIIPMDKGKWHNYIGVYNGSEHRFYLYVDGVYIGRTSANIADFQFGSNNAQWRIWSNTAIGGSGDVVKNQPATLDDILIFDRALTDNEITALYLNKANTPKYYGEVPVTRKISGHTLEEDITLAKSDVGLDNVVNTGDSATPVSGGTTKFTTGGAYTELAKKVDKTTTVNGHALSGNVTVTKSDVGLGNVANINLSNVVNTGDSATPVSGGTTKFTTGGAYTELNKKFDKTSAGDQVTYSLSGNTLTITSK